MVLSRTFVSVLVILFVAVCAAPPEQWENRRIYQVLTDRFASDHVKGAPKCASLEVGYCGGDFAGLQERLDYIRWLGFNAVWISPHVDQTPTQAYHGYHGRDFYKTNNHFGSETALHSLISAAHDRDIFVMADLVANHAGPVNQVQGVQPGQEINFNMINPFNEKADYHEYCEITDWNNYEMIEKCRLSGLPDLNQNNPKTRQKALAWGEWTMKNYAFDGVRLDTVIEVPHDFWGEFLQALKKGSMENPITKDSTFVIGEAFTGDINKLAEYADVMDGLLAYPVFFTVRGILASGGSMWDLRSTLEGYRLRMPNARHSGLFIGNHDNDRFPLLSNHSEMRQIAAYVWQFTYEGIPLFYYGDELMYSGALDHNTNREVFWINGFREAATRPRTVMVLKRLNALLDSISFDYAPRYGWTDDNTLSYHRGELLVVLNNIGDVPSSTKYITLPAASHPYAAKQKLCNALDVDENWNIYCPTVAENGDLTLELIGGTSLVLIPSTRVADIQRALRAQEKFATSWE